MKAKLSKSLLNCSYPLRQTLNQLKVNGLLKAKYGDKSAAHLAELYLIVVLAIQETNREVQNSTYRVNEYWKRIVGPYEEGYVGALCDLFPFDDEICDNSEEMLENLLEIAPLDEVALVSLDTLQYFCITDTLRHFDFVMRARREVDQ
jgi:hypothetical protein